MAHRSCRKMYLNDNLSTTIKMVRAFDTELYFLCETFECEVRHKLAASSILFLTMDALRAISEEPRGAGRNNYGPQGQHSCFYWNFFK